MREIKREKELERGGEKAMFKKRAGGERDKHRGRRIGSEESLLRTPYKGYKTNSVRFPVICIQEWFECFTLGHYLAHQK